MIANFTLKGLPKMTNTLGPSHWRTKHAEAKKWKGLVVEECALKRITNLWLTSAALTLTRHSSREPDFDGLVSGFKHVLDGLVLAGVLVSDKPSVIGQPKYFWKYASHGKGMIEVRVEPFLINT